MLTCRQIVDSGSDYLDQRLGRRRRLAVWLHIAMCGACRVYLQQLRLSVQALRALRRAAPPATTREALLRQFRAESLGQDEGEAGS